MSGRGGRMVLVAAMALWWCACTPEGGGDDPNSSTTVPPSSTAPPGPPPPPTTTVPAEPETRPEDYIHAQRAPQVLEWLVPGTQELSNRGWRAMEDVAVRCSWAFPSYFGVTPDEALDFAERAMEITHDAEQRFIPNLRSVNRRCDDPEYPSERWCDRTNVRKEFFERFRTGDWYEGEPRNFDEALAQTRAFQNRGQECFDAILAAGGGAYDSVGGWCTRMNELGWRTEDCP